MMLYPENSYAKIITFISLITSIYVPLYILLLVYTANLYEFGHFNFLPLLLVICGAEVIKFILTTSFTDSTFGNEKSKIKKICMKLKVKEIFKTIYVFIGSTAIFYGFAVLYGAKLIDEYEETLMFSLLMTSLTIFPACLYLSADNTISLITGASNLQNSIANMLLRNILFTLVGAWLGSILIPLDWAVPYKVWPIPCCIGAIIGFLTSHLLVLIMCIPVPFLNKFKYSFSKVATLVK